MEHNKICRDMVCTDVANEKGENKTSFFLFISQMLFRILIRVVGVTVIHSFTR